MNPLVSVGLSILYLLRERELDNNIIIRMISLLQHYLR